MSGCSSLLVLIGICCLVFGWPWGAVVGAILLLAGVIAGKGK
jgi:hypothetical protein